MIRCYGLDSCGSVQGPVTDTYDGNERTALVARKCLSKYVNGSSREGISSMELGKYLPFKVCCLSYLLLLSCYLTAIFKDILVCI